MITTAALANHLAANVHLIARLETAGQCFNDIHNTIETIERMINRPIPDRFVGPCPTLLQDGRCGAALVADRKATEVLCRQCKITHDIETVEQGLWDTIDEWLLSSTEIHLVMEHFGCPIPASTIRRWRMEDRLPIRGWRNGKPRYWAKDVRDLREGKEIVA